MNDVKKEVVCPELVCPVVSCQGLDRPGSQEYDRRWFVVDEAGQWLSASSAPGLSQVSCEVRMGSLVLRAPGMLRLDIPMDVIEDDDSVRKQVMVSGQKVNVVDEGDVCATWFSHVAGKTCRLVKVHPDAPATDWPED